MFYYHNNNKLCGIILLHVDDFVFAGNQKFQTNVIKPLLDKYVISKHEQSSFKYIGIDINQSKSGIILDQKDYTQCVKTVDISASRKQQSQEPLSQEEHTQYLSLLGKLSWLSQITRPDLKFDVYQFSRYNKHPTVQNLRDLNGVVSKLNTQKEIHFPRLDPKEPWKIIVYADASFANLDNKVNSARGYIVLLCAADKACILKWNANKITRVVTSTLEAETLALRDGIRHAELLRSIIIQLLYDSDTKQVLPIIAFTDSNQLQKSVYSTKHVKDHGLRRDICLIQEKLASSIISEVRWVKTSEQIADCLTKKGVDTRKLDMLLETGQLFI